MTSRQPPPSPPKAIAFIEDDAKELLSPKRLADPKLLRPERQESDVERFVLGKKEKKRNPFFEKISKTARKAGLLSVVGFATFLVAVIVSVVFYVLNLYS